MEKTTHEGEGEQGQLQAGWDELASETWLCIFDFLGSPRDLTCLACTCRQFAGLVLGTNLLWRALALHRRWPQEEGQVWDKATFQEELIRRVRFGLRGIGPRTIPDHEFEKEGYLSFERTLPDDNRSLLERLQYGKLSAIVNLLMQRETDLEASDRAFDELFYNYYPGHTHAELLEALFDAMPMLCPGQCDQDYFTVWRREMKRSRPFSLLLRWVDLYPDLILPADVYTPETPFNLIRRHLESPAYAGTLRPKDIELLLANLAAERKRLHPMHPLRDEPEAEPSATDEACREEDVLGALRHFLEASPRDLAVQLTSLERDLFLRVSVTEFKNCGWVKKDARLISPHVVQLVHQFNRISRMVASSVLLGRPTMNETPQDRATMIVHWIRIAQELKELGNYNTLLAVISGLNTTYLFRLKRTRQIVQEQHADLWRAFSGLENLMSSNSEYLHYQTELRATQGPCLPYLGAILMSITYAVEETLTSSPYPVNLRRWRRLSKVFDDFRQYRHAASQYQLSPSPQAAQIIGAILAASANVNDDLLYSLTMEAEPRQPGPTP